VLDGQVGENLIILLDRVAAFGHHSGHEQLRSGDSVRRRVDELLLDARSLARVACPGRIGEWLDVKTLDPALAFGQLGFRLAPAVALTCHSVIFRAEALPEPAAARYCHHAKHNCPNHDDGRNDAHDNPS
jgi:hypothetical protein